MQLAVVHMCCLMVQQDEDHVCAGIVLQVVFVFLKVAWHFAVFKMGGTSPGACSTAHSTTSSCQPHTLPQPAVVPAVLAVRQLVVRCRAVQFNSLFTPQH